MRRAVVLLPWLLACGSHHGSTDAGPVHGQMLRATNLSHNHLPTCDDPGCGNGANPPLGGDHCPVWLNCRVWSTAQPKCNWVHNLEHGHLVMLYNCTHCDALVQSLSDFQSTHPRSLVTPDPELPDQVAVMVWGFGWLGDGFDPDAFNQVATHQDEEAPEPGLGCSP